MNTGLCVTHAISLTQPWATLMATGKKVNETRSWRTSYRGWVAIHAAKGFPSDCFALCGREPFWQALIEAGQNPKALPRGAILAVARIVDCTPTANVRDSLSDRERAFGDYSDHRYAFLTTDLRALREPIPMKGALSFWKLARPITEADLA